MSIVPEQSSKPLRAAKFWSASSPATGGGTNLGSVAGRPATGKKAIIDVVDICRFEDGKMVEHWGVPDQLGMMVALGLIQ